MPAIRRCSPDVVTAGGQRLLLNYFDSTSSPTLGTPVTVTYDPKIDQLVSNKPGWWIINYPLDQIIGLPDINNPCGLTDQQIKDTVAADLFGAGQTAATVQNWYIMTPVDSAHPLAPEPNSPTGPAPITPTNLANSANPLYVLVVDSNPNDTTLAQVETTYPQIATRLQGVPSGNMSSTIYNTMARP